MATPLNLLNLMADRLANPQPAASESCPHGEEVARRLQQLAATTQQLQASLHRIREAAAQAQMIGFAMRLAESGDTNEGLAVVAETFQQLGAQLFTEGEAMAEMLPAMSEDCREALRLLDSGNAAGASGVA